MASRVTGIDVIFGGHTHDAIPTPTCNGIHLRITAIHLTEPNNSKNVV